ncbi:hypothetical protein N8987_00860 [Crocinitomix sp.]|nr:hypothetical protein [Crocinitomix sp.]
MENKRSNGLTALCVLSLISLAFQAYSITMSMSNGRVTDEQIKEQKIALLENQTPETAEAMKWMVEDAEKISRVQQEHYTLLTFIDAVGLIVGLMAVMLMFRLRKLGFHLYIIYTLIAIFYWTYFYSGLGSTAVLIGFSSLIGILFVALYGVQAKKMV